MKDLTFLQKQQLELSQLIFKSPENSILSSASLNRDIKIRCEQAGIDRFTAHGFRDTFATRALESGMHPKTLQETLGHASFEMTMDVYAHVMPETMLNEMEMVQVTRPKTGTEDGE